MWNVAVTTTKKSLASTHRAWFLTNVVQARLPAVGRGDRDSIYRRTVRGDTRIPSFTSSSLAMLSSPHVRFDAAIVAISRCTSTGIAGRPGARDFQRQNNRNP